MEMLKQTVIRSGASCFKPFRFAAMAMDSSASWDNRKSLIRIEYEEKHCVIIGTNAEVLNTVRMPLDSMPSFLIDNKIEYAKPSMVKKNQLTLDIAESSDGWYDWKKIMPKSKDCSLKELSFPIDGYKAENDFALSVFRLAKANYCLNPKYLKSLSVMDLWEADLLYQSENSLPLALFSASDLESDYQSLVAGIKLPKELLKEK